MKYIIIVLLMLSFSSRVHAQGVEGKKVKETVLKTINDDGKKMQVKLTVDLHDVSINFDKTYDVTNWTKERKNTLINQIIDSLGAAKYFKAETLANDNKLSEKALITAAVKDYVEALYEADTSKIEKSVAKHLAKRGYYTNNGVMQDATMTYDQLINLTKRWKSTQTITESTPKKIVVLDILDKIASAKLEAKWGIDYFHLSKEDGKWMIVNVLWQEYPTKK